jgi:protein-disulfide isomerase
VSGTAVLWATVVAVVLTLGMIGLSRAAVSEGSFEVVDANGSSPTPTPTSPASTTLPPAPTELPTAEELGTGHSLGSPDARVTVTQFAEYQCTVCQRFFLENEEELTEAYIETGKIRFVFKQFVMYGEESMNAALAAEAAADQGKFWEYHSLLMQQEASPKEEDLTVETLQNLAGELGLDMEKFNAALLSDKHRDKIERDFAQGRAMGVRGTPTFFVHGGAGEGVTRKGEGNISFDKFKELIDVLLEESQAE